ncbi:MAG: hypothetical protein JEY94_04665 [Melioribacteraceae bacterium]|nr:hypothetical protein [Melioribacteraceae bacterium]
MNADIIKQYKYSGAASMILQHENYMRSLYRTWLKAKELKIHLPKTEDEDYKSLETLLLHFVRSSRGYIIWICEKLDLPDPRINAIPVVENIDREADKYINHLIERWKLPLVNVPEEKFYSPTFKSNWGVEYCVDAMLEHAVMHLIRHEYQLKNLIKYQKGLSLN